MILAYSTSDEHVVIYRRVVNGPSATFQACSVVRGKQVLIMPGIKAPPNETSIKLAREWPDLKEKLKDIMTGAFGPASLDSYFAETLTGDTELPLLLSIYLDFFRKLMSVRMLWAQYHREPVEVRVTAERTLNLYERMMDYMLIPQSEELFRQDMDLFNEKYRGALDQERFWDVGYKIFVQTPDLDMTHTSIQKVLSINETPHRLQCLIRIASSRKDYPQVIDACERLSQKVQLMDQELTYKGVAHARLNQFDAARNVQKALMQRGTADGQRLATRLGALIQSRIAGG